MRHFILLLVSVWHVLSYWRCLSALSTQTSYVISNLMSIIPKPGISIWPKDKCLPQQSDFFSNSLSNNPNQLGKLMENPWTKKSRYHVGSNVPLWTYFHSGAIAPTLGLQNEPLGPIKQPSLSRPLGRETETPATPIGFPPASSPALQGLSMSLLAGMLGADGPTLPGVRWVTNGCSYLCTFTLNAMISQRRALRLLQFAVASAWAVVQSC